MELITWLVSSEFALNVAALVALALTSVAILRDVVDRGIAQVPSIGPG